MKQRHIRQSGMTFVGLCFVLAFIGIVVLFVLRAFPLYNMKFQVVAAMNSITSRPDATSMSDADVKKYFLRNIQVTNIQLFNDHNINQYLEVIKPKDRRDPRMLRVHYETRNPLFGDLELLMKFDEKKPLRGPVDSE